MRGAIPPLPQYAFMAWCSVKAQGQLFTFTCIKHSIFCTSLEEMLSSLASLTDCNFYPVIRLKFVSWLLLEVKSHGDILGSYGAWRRTATQIQSECALSHLSWMEEVFHLVQAICFLLTQEKVSVLCSQR
jgi:hypothetical protein